MIINTSKHYRVQTVDGFWTIDTRGEPIRNIMTYPDLNTAQRNLVRYMTKQRKEPEAYPFDVEIRVIEITHDVKDVVANDVDSHEWKRRWFVEMARLHHPERIVNGLVAIYNATEHMDPSGITHVFVFDQPVSADTIHIPESVEKFHIGGNFKGNMMVVWGDKEAATVRLFLDDKSHRVIDVSNLHYGYKEHV